MKFKIKSEKLKKTMSAIQPICQKKTISDFTQHALLEIDNQTMITKATDLETTVEINNEIEEIIKKSNINKILINAKICSEIIREIEKEFIVIEFLENKCTIETDQSQIELNTIEIENFKDQDLIIENILKIDRNYIIDSIGFCAPLSTSNIHKNTTATILFEIDKDTLKATSTDGHCLSHIKINFKNSNEHEKIRFLLSKKAATDIKKIIETISQPTEEIIIGKSTNRSIITGNCFSIAVKNINESFPEYNKILNISPKEEFICQRSTFVKIAKRLCLFTEGKFIPAIMTVKKDKINFKIKNSGIGQIEEEIDTNFVKKNDNIDEEKEESIALYPPYILKAASENDIEEVINIKLHGKQKPIIFFSKKNEIDMYYIVMPMQGV